MEEMKMDESKKSDIRSAVRESYAKVAQGGNAPAMSASSCCSPSPSATENPNEKMVATSCCGDEVSDKSISVADISAKLGYSENDLEGIPDGANMGLGCGNPQAIAVIKKGETVLDLGSGGGFDVFLAARQTGDAGRVIGVDFTPEMIEKARKNARELKLENVEFRLGEIENLPVKDKEVDVIISNCVINLSPDKSAVFREAFRALRPGGRLAVSDVVAIADIPDEMKADMALLSGCVSGAAKVDEVKKALADAGFTDIAVDPKSHISKEFINDWAPGMGIEKLVASANIMAKRPLGADGCC
jgi:SAM-dependent methyltransferase